MLKKIEAERDDLESMRRKSEACLAEEKQRSKDLVSWFFCINEVSKHI